MNKTRARQQKHGHKKHGIRKNFFWLYQIQLTVQNGEISLSKYGDVSPTILVLRETHCATQKKKITKIVSNTKNKLFSDCVPEKTGRNFLRTSNTDQTIPFRILHQSNFESRYVHLLKKINTIKLSLIKLRGQCSFRRTV